MFPRETSKKLLRLSVALFVLVFAIDVANAVNPDERLGDPVLEQRARDLSAEIRCMKCQNQSIDDSDADLARDLRIMVRERLVAGDSDQQVLDYLVDRFGEFILLRPRFSLSNLILWIAPVLALIVGFMLSLRLVKSRHVKDNPVADRSDLSKEEHEALEEIFNERD